MFSRLLSRTPLAALLAVAACADVGDSELALDSVRQALDVCGETVPPARFIDGFPAYAQCDAFANSAIYSNNGVDTSATKVGADWHRTQYSGGYQCTELATRYFHFKWKVDYVPRGNAGTWCDAEPPASSGVVKTTTPVHGDLMVLAPGSCGAAPQTGHVNVVDTVDMASGKLVAVEQNMARRGSYKIDCAKCFLHAVVNDGSAPTDAGAPVAADAGPTEAGTKPADASTRDAGTKDAGKPADDEPREDEPRDDEPAADAGKARDAGTPSLDDEDDEPNAEEPVTSSEGCAVGSSSSTNILLALGLLLSGRRRRKTARG